MRVDVDGFHEVHRLDLGGATAFLAIHAAPHGRSFGGIRLRSYDSDDAALDAAKRLASAMTRKVLLAGIPAGGGKTVVRIPAEGWPEAQRRAGMELLGEFIEDMSGLYHCGADLGFTDRPLDLVHGRAPKGHVHDVGGGIVPGHQSISSTRRRSSSSSMRSL